jgi:hypothetical protein
MQIGDDQTDAAEVQKVDPLHRGSGVFAVPDPEQATYMAYTKKVVPNITYPECRQRGAFCIAFKWVPRTLDAAITTCPQPPNGMLCVKSCANDVCFNHQCAVPASG